SDFSDFTDSPTQTRLKLSCYIYCINLTSLMNKLAYLFFALLFLLSAESCHDRQGKNYNKEVQVQEVDPTTFIKDGIEGSMTEIKASGLAITNSNNQKVISLAKMLIEDHTKVDSAL